MSKSSTKKWALGALLAAAAGYVAGILTAPKSGKATRAGIQKKATSAKNDAEMSLKELHNELGELIKQSKSKLSGATKTVQKGFSEVLNGAESAKNKIHDVLKALKSSNVDVKELQKAMKDANKSVDHLKKFLGKHPTAPKKR